MASYVKYIMSLAGKLSLSRQGLRQFLKDLNERLESEDTTHLDISGNQLSSLPPEVGDFAQLV